MKKQPRKKERNKERKKDRKKEREKGRREGRKEGDVFFYSKNPEKLIITEYMECAVQCCTVLF